MYIIGLHEYMWLIAYEHLNRLTACTYYGAEPLIAR